MKLKAFAKINWILDIVGEKDGFHMLDGVMETVDIFDVVEVKLRDDGKIYTAYDGIKVMEGDLCKRAAEFFFKQTDINYGADIHVTKKIPIGAGLGGGSSDGACVLFALNQLCGKVLSEDELCNLAAQLGADAAFFIRGGAQRAKGKGEILTPIKRNNPLEIVIAKPVDGVSTPQAYKLYDEMSASEKGNVEAMINALESGDINEIAGNMFNALEKPSAMLLPEIEDVKNRLVEAGAVSALMTGSGSAVFGVIGDLPIDESKLDGLWFCKCKTVPSGVEIINGKN